MNATATLVSAQPMAGPIFTINFIRRYAVAPRLRSALVWLGLAYLAANIVVALWLIGSAVALMAQRASAPAAPGAVTAEAQPLYDQAQIDVNRLNGIIGRETARFRVGGKLAALTATLPARTWMTGISSDRDKRTLTIAAAYLIDPQRPYELPTTAWLESLKSDARFSRDLKRLEVVSSSRTTHGRAELFVFELAAEWKGLRTAR